MGRYWLFAAAVLGALGVLIGAFGAHWLQGQVKSWTSDTIAQQRLLSTWETGVRYQMYHALALLAVGLLAERRPQRLLHVAGGSLLVGTLIFSGTLYALVLSGVKVLGAVTPLGGVAMIAGWLLLAGAAFRRSGSPEAV